jgi:hypothetical protein
MPPRGLKVLWVTVSPDEHAFVHDLAAKEGISACQFVRDCINDRLAEEGESIALLAFREAGRPREAS